MNSGKYNFKGIKKYGAAGLRSALYSTPKLAWLNKFPALTNFILEFVSNWLANKGLIVLNLGTIYIDSKIDQIKFDQSLDKAIEEIKIKSLNNRQLTAKEIKEIDDEVIKAARPFIMLTRTK